MAGVRAGGAPGRGDRSCRFAGDVVGYRGAVTDHRPPPPVAGAGPAADQRPPPPVAVRRRAWRSSPIPLGLAILSVPLAAWFTIWGLDNVNHCDDPSLPKTACGLGFAIDIPVSWLVMAALAGAAGGLGAVRLPRWAAWAIGLGATAAIWGLAWLVLAFHRP